MDLMDLDLDDSYGRDEHIARPVPTSMRPATGDYAAASVSSTTAGEQGLSKWDQRDISRWGQLDDWVGSRPGGSKLMCLSSSKEDETCYGRPPPTKPMPPVVGPSVPLMNLEFQPDGDVTVNPRSLKRKASCEPEPSSIKSKKWKKREQARINAMSFPEKLAELSEIVRRMELPSENFSQIMEGVISQSRLGLKLEVDGAIFSTISTLQIWSGKLTINDNFIARAIGQGRRETKNEACKMAYHLLTNKSVVELLSLTDPGVEKVKALVTDLEAKGGVTAVVEALGFKDVEAKVKKLMKEIPEEAFDSREALYTKWYGKLELVIVSLKKAMEEDRLPSAISLGKVVHDAKIGSQLDYTCRTTPEHIYQATIRIGRVPIATLEGDDNAKLRQDVFELAVNNLLNNSIDELVKQCPGVNVIKSAKDTQKKKLPCTFDVSRQAEITLDYKFDVLLQRIQSSELDTSNAILLIDGYTIQCLLTPVLYYSAADRGNDGEEQLLCELYMNDIFIASAVGPNYKAAMYATYTKIWDIFKKGSASEILEGSRITEAMKYDKKYLEVCQKGQSQFPWDNTRLLESMHPKGADLSRPLSDLVVLETEEWAREGAFSVLYNSTSKCGLLMEWVFIKDAHTNSKCSVSIQKNLLAVSKHSQRYKAREESSLKAFKILCETNDFIQEHPRDYSQNWFTWEEIQEDAAQAEDIPTVDVHDNEYELIIKHEQEVSYVCYIIEKYFNDENNQLMDWVSDTYMPQAEQQFIKYHVTTVLGLDARQKTHIDGRLFLIASKRISLPTIAEILKQSKTKSVGKYSLLNVDGKISPTLPSMVLEGLPVPVQNMAESSSSMTCPKLCDQLFECTDSNPEKQIDLTKGVITGKVWQSNVSQLLSTYPDYNEEDLTRPLSEIILMEHGHPERNIKTTMFPNIRNSATTSRICVDWSLEKKGRAFECNVFLQKEFFASGQGNKVAECRQEAFTYAALVLYKTNSVIQFVPKLQTILNWSELVVEAKDFEPEPIDEVVLTYDDSMVSMKYSVETMYLCSVMRYYFQSSSDKKYLDLEIFGMPEDVAIIAKKYATAELSCEHRRRRDGADFVHIFLLPPASLLELLKAIQASESGRVGKYQLLSPECLQARLKDLPAAASDKDVTPDTARSKPEMTKID